jgi:hypothetical protein
MIRDPADGSVKEINLPASEINALPSKKAAKGITMARYRGNKSRH